MSAVFSSTEQLHDIMHDLWSQIAADPEMSLKLVESRLISQFRYREPFGLITVDSSDGQKMKIIVGDTDIKPHVEMAMKADVAHEFWLGRVSIPVAILSGKIVSKGPVNKALALLPVIKPAYSIYPHIYEKWTEKAVASK
jgi:hypothetical protein